MISLGNGAGSGPGPVPPSPSPWSVMFSELLLLLELARSPAGAATGALLSKPLCGDSRNPPGETGTAFPSSVADSARSCWGLSLASSLAASSIENCFFVSGLTKGPCSSPAHC